MGDKRDLKKDFAWDFVKQVDGEKYFKCKFCNHKCSGTITRLKNHIAGTHTGIAPCKSAPEDAKLKCQFALQKLKDHNQMQNEILHEIRMTPKSGSASDSGSVRAPKARVRGPMDAFTLSEPRQATLNSQWKKEERKDVCRKIARFCFSKALPFNVVNDPYWVPMFESVANFGPGFKPPSMHEMRTWLLKEEVDDINKLKEQHMKAWEEYGCSIMSDGWSDGKNRCLINFLVNSPAGTWFLKSVDASNSIKSGDLMFNLLDQIIEEVGEDNVVQILTDNASNYVYAGKRLMEKRVRLYWTPCAAHCIDLMLEDISKIKLFQMTIANAKDVVKFIYGHSWVLALMRFHTKNQEIIRPAITRFATSFLTLQSLYKQKQSLMTMFSSDKWASSTWAKKPDGMKVCATVLHNGSFWGDIAYCIKSVGPLVSVLREVDSEVRPAMGYIYELMDAAKEKIQIGCGGNIKKYGPIWKRIDARWTPQLHQPLHAAGYYLNPSLRYDVKFSNVEEVRQGLTDCMERMLPYEERLKADIQLDLYDHARGNFGSRMAIDSRKLRSPADWWGRFGGKTLELQRFAIRVLSLTCSASGCERNWSTFEAIHTKKRNRLEHQRLNALVYVMYNTRLRERSIKRKLNVDPILLEEIESDDEWIAEKEDPILPLDTSWIEDEQLFNVDAIRSVSVVSSANGEESSNPSPSIVISEKWSSAAKRNTSGHGDDMCKNKAPRVVLVGEGCADDVQTFAGQSGFAPSTNMDNVFLFGDNVDDELNLGNEGGNTSNPTIDDEEDEFMDEENVDELDDSDFI